MSNAIASRCVRLARMASGNARSMSGPGGDAGACSVCGAPLPAHAAIRGRDRLLGTRGDFAVHVCAACGSGVTLPRVADEDLGAYYGSRYGSHAEPREGVYARASAALKRAQVAALLRRPPFSRAVTVRATGAALDVGCARGDLGAALRARGWRVDGIEPSAEAAELASARGVRVIGETIASAPLGAEEYDVIVMRHSLEHVADPRAAMRALGSALRPSGRIVISLPNFACWQRARLSSRWFHLDLPRHRAHFTRASLRGLLEGSGLSVAEEFTTTSVLGLPASIQYALVGRCLAPRGLGLRAGAALCCAVFPLTWLLDGVGGERDTIHVVAERAR
jgi:SAM-dependent methyltransferase